ncbi:MAG: ACT domain-containing protein [Chloroflexi bacterium]|nr:MAG: ACT domain-containing protein [Chloroflexota bacterium]
MTSLSLTVLDGTYTIHRLSSDSIPPTPVFSAPFYSITRNADELSIVIPQGLEIKSDNSEPGWACLRVAGTLDFSLVGILAGISSALAQAGISIFAISTFDTDFILVKESSLERACEALGAAGYAVNMHYKKSKD